MRSRRPVASFLAVKTLGTRNVWSATAGPKLSEPKRGGESTSACYLSAGQEGSRGATHRFPGLGLNVCGQGVTPGALLLHCGYPSTAVKPRGVTLGHVAQCCEQQDPLHLGGGEFAATRASNTTLQWRLLSLRIGYGMGKGKEREGSQTLGVMGSFDLMSRPKV